ncbi:MAG: hypothetical protein LRZ92_02995 [Methanosarcinaceae archaeon]|jgi:archaellum biogenesis ATPase FlaH|nr:hypothetical protein [Methanosarcinaceae archaeon]
MKGIFNSIIESIPQGSIVLFDASSIITSEIVINEFIKGKTTIYFVIDRNLDGIKTGMENMGLDMELVEIIELNEISEKNRIIEAIQKNHDSYIVIDTVIKYIDDLELIRNIVRHIKKNNNLIFLHVPKGCVDEQRMNYLLYVSDVVFTLDSERIGDEIVIKFAVPKLRLGVPLMRYMRLVMGSDSVFIDTSRDIS